MDIKVIAVIVCMLAVLIYASYDAERKRRLKLEKSLRNSWGKPSDNKTTQEEYEIISHSFKDYIQDKNEYIDDITWKDLNMDEVFRVMNTNNSSLGQEYLYKMLRCPDGDTGNLKKTDTLAKFFGKEEKKRFTIQKIFAKMGFAKYVSLSDYIGLIVELEQKSNIFHYILLLLYVVAAAVCFVNPVCGVAGLIAVMVIAIISYYKMKADVESYFICVIQIVKMINTSRDIIECNYKELDDYNKELEKLSEECKGVISGSWLLETGDVNGSIVQVLLDYLRMITHVDLIKFNGMAKNIRQKENQIYNMYEVLGMIEASIAVASFRQMLPYWSEPDFVSDKQYGIHAKDVYHPLIKNPVANSLETKNNIILTGSNASGKSTFLRTIAINAVLSQSIYTSTSSEYVAPQYRIYSSMSLMDDLSNNSSYYIVEIRSLKRIIDAACTGGKPVLCFVDEVLRGTNTVERIAASSEILKFISGKNVLCVAATHDIELTAILSKWYDNYHFQEEVTDDEVMFNYKLYKGPATTRNAIKLLNMMGYDKEIITESEKRAAYFVENGVWKM